MSSIEHIDRSIWIVDGGEKLYPKVAPDGSYRVFTGPKSSDSVPVFDRQTFIDRVFGERLAARLAPDSTVSTSNRRSVFDGRATDWGAEPEVKPLIEAVLQRSNRRLPPLLENAIRDAGLHL